MSKIRLLISYQNGNAYGGSENFNYELITELANYKDLDITVATFTEPNLDFHMFKDMINLGVKVKPLQGLKQEENEFDLIIVSQPYPTQLLCHLYFNTPKISIIHSVIRSEELIKHESIKEYVSVQVDIYKHLKSFYNINYKNISLIYNPVDETRFNIDEIHLSYKNPKPTGLLVGEVNDPIRIPMIEHMVQNCIENDWNLIIISHSKRDFNNRLIQIIEPTYNTETWLKNVNFAVGLRGRVCIESLMCGTPFYAYDINNSGQILKVELLQDRKVWRFKKKFVCSQYYNLIQKYK